MAKFRIDSPILITMLASTLILIIGFTVLFMGSGEFKFNNIFGIVLVGIGLILFFYSLCYNKWYMLFFQHFII